MSRVVSPSAHDGTEQFTDLVIIIISTHVLPLRTAQPTGRLNRIPRHHLIQSNRLCITTPCPPHQQNRSVQAPHCDGILRQRSLRNHGPPTVRRTFTLRVKQLDWQIDCAAQICSALMPALSDVQKLRLDFDGPMIPMNGGMVRSMAQHGMNFSGRS